MHRSIALFFLLLFLFPACGPQSVNEVVSLGVEQAQVEGLAAERLSIETAMERLIEKVCAHVAADGEEDLASCRESAKENIELAENTDCVELGVVASRLAACERHVAAAAQDIAEENLLSGLVSLAALEVACAPEMLCER